jgi:phenylacetate-CoA ligase
MSLSFLIRLQDIFKGTNINRTYQFLRESDKWSFEILEAYQLRKLQALVLHAYLNVPYYNAVFKSSRIRPDDIRSLNDIKNIPLLNKEIALREGKNLYATNIKISDRRITHGKTGGTTGVPLKILKDTQTRNFTWGAYYRWYDWMRINNNDRIISLWGDKKVLSHGFKQQILDYSTILFSGTRRISAFRLNADSVPTVVRKIIDYKPVLIRGYLSAIYQVGLYLKEYKIKIPSLKAVSTTTETLLPFIREFITEAYMVPVFDQYGCGECGSIAFECEMHNGLHISQEHAFIEILDNNNEPIVDKSGKIIMTDLDNYAMPFIRYENGDLGTILSSRCDCGRPSKILGDIQGRSKDTIFLKDGRAVHGVFFTDIMHEMNFLERDEVIRFQVYQCEKGKIEFRLESRSKSEISVEKKEALEANLLKFFDKVNITLNNLSYDESGKFRYLISDIKDK